MAKVWKEIKFETLVRHIKFVFQQKKLMKRINLKSHDLDHKDNPNKK